MLNCKSGIGVDMALDRVESFSSICKGWSHRYQFMNIGAQRPVISMDLHEARFCDFRPNIKIRKLYSGYFGLFRNQGSITLKYTALTFVIVRNIVFFLMLCNFIVLSLFIFPGDTSRFIIIGMLWGDINMLHWNSKLGWWVGASITEKKNQFC